MSSATEGESCSVEYYSGTVSHWGEDSEGSDLDSIALYSQPSVNVSQRGRAADLPQRLRAAHLLHASSASPSDAKGKGLQQPRGQHATLSALWYTSVLS